MQRAQAWARRKDRHPVEIEAVVQRTDGSKQPVKLSNFSDQGCRIEADGIFRQAMRKDDVPFLRRWIMWAAVRLGALTNSAGREKWWTEAWRVALIAALALPVITPAAVVIVISFLVFYLIEFLVWIPLAAVHWIREKRNQPAKKVNPPTLRWRL